jgi:glycosyltransferase involved in cell wall biosynthesis
VDLLPLPPRGSHGWPWDDLQPNATRVTQNTNLPKISIVTPSYNQAKYLEQTIRSVLLQGYPNLEFFVIDGGSTDGSVDILKRYDRLLTHWVSQPDDGQADAINRGFAMATGEIYAYINSDDYYLPGAFAAVANEFQQNPSADLIHGICQYVDTHGVTLGQQLGAIRSSGEMLDIWRYWRGGPPSMHFVQPEVFWRSNMARKIGPFHRDLHYVMDFEYWLRVFLAGGKVHQFAHPLAAFRKTPEQKTQDVDSTILELLNVIQPYLWGSKVGLSRFKRLCLQGDWQRERLRIDNGLPPERLLPRDAWRFLRNVPRHPQLLFCRKLLRELIPDRISTLVRDQDNL